MDTSYEEQLAFIGTSQV